MTGTALLIVQKPTSDPGRVGAALASLGFALDIRCPNEGTPLPHRADALSAVVVFGGPMSANDTDTLSGLRAQMDFLGGVLAAGTPLLGICLGAQLMARTLGAEVRRHPHGLVEIGYHPIAPTAESDGLFDGPMMVYQWHREGFDLPAGATRLAAGSTFENQAFRYGANAYGVQFHPEAGRATIELWTEKAAHDLCLPGAQARDAQLAAFERHDPANDRWLQRFCARVFAAAAR